MPRAKSIKHFKTKDEKLRKKRLPYQMKKTMQRYRKKDRLARALKIQPNAAIYLSKIKIATTQVSDEERTLRKKSKKKVKRKRNNAKGYINRKLKKQAALRTAVVYDTPEKRDRLTDVYDFDPVHVHNMDRFEVNIIFYI